METLASTPANAEEISLDNANADATAKPGEGDGSAPSAPEAGTPEPPVQERFDKLTRDKYDALREGDRKGYLLEQRERELTELRAKLEERESKQVAPANGPPTLEQYGYDEGKYHAAVAEHFTKIAETQGRAAAEAYFKETQQRQEAENANKNWTVKETEFVKLKPDYAEKVSKDPRDGGPAISESMFKICQESAVGPQILYHLSENVEQSKLIYQLPPLAQAREIGRIEAKLELAKLPPKPLVSQAPPPVNKVENNDAPVEKNPGDMSDAEFAKWRRKQISARRNS